MENKNLNLEQQELANTYTDIFMELYGGNYFNETYNNDIEQLTPAQQTEIRNAIISIDPDAINAAYANLQPASIYGADIGQAIGDSVAMEADLAAKAETIAQVNPQIYADWQNTLKQEEIHAVEQMIEHNGLSIDNPGLQEFMHDASVAVGSPELYERLYHEQVESFEKIELETGQSVRDVVETIAEEHVAAQKETSVENDAGSIEYD